MNEQECPRKAIEDILIESIATAVVNSGLDVANHIAVDKFIDVMEDAIPGMVDSILREVKKGMN